MKNSRCGAGSRRDITGAIPNQYIHPASIAQEP